MAIKNNNFRKIIYGGLLTFGFLGALKVTQIIERNEENIQIQDEFGECKILHKSDLGRLSQFDGLTLKELPSKDYFIFDEALDIGASLECPGDGFDTQYLNNKTIGLDSAKLNLNRHYGGVEYTLFGKSNELNRAYFDKGNDGTLDWVVKSGPNTRRFKAYPTEQDKMDFEKVRNHYLNKSE